MALCASKFDQDAIYYLYLNAFAHSHCNLLFVSFYHSYLKQLMLKEFVIQLIIISGSPDPRIKLHHDQEIVWIGIKLLALQTQTRLSKAPSPYSRNWIFLSSPECFLCWPILSRQNVYPGSVRALTGRSHVSHKPKGNWNPRNLRLPAVIIQSPQIKNTNAYRHGAHLEVYKGYWK